MTNETTPRGPERQPPDLAGGEFSTFALEESEDSRVLRRSLWAAAIIHAVLLAVTFPQLHSQPLPEKPKQEVFVITNHRFEPPPPKPQQEIPKQRVKKQPIPDPDPTDPEPILIDEPDPVLDIPDVDEDILFGIPTAPPAVEPDGPIHVGGEVSAPVKVNAPQPQYTEIARRARIQGVVIVQAIIDKGGRVTNVKMLKGLPMGLDEEAVKAIKQWTFKPATLNGKPVDVYYNLTVNFRLQ